ncbi:MAG: type II toxin-antitoxin system VapC family toxin [Bacteroidota bacterium]|nr:type II toxin-antitoxin system VapC family toxin [Bacteroidota bacterium]
MNGNKYLLDTNAVVALLKGDNKLQNLLQNAKWIGISIITQLEILSFPNLTESDKLLFQSFLKRLDVIGLEVNAEKLIDSIVNFRKIYRMKLPDAIITATAKEHESALITRDERFNSIKEIKVISF